MIDVDYRQILPDLQAPWLTEIRLTKRAKDLVRDSQAVHRTLAHAVGETALWALPTPGLLIVQASKPIRPDDMPGVIQMAAARPKPTRFGTGQTIEIAGIVNPTKAIASARGTRGKITHLQPDEWAAWAERKLGCITIRSLDMRHQGTHVGRRHGMQTRHMLVSMRAVGTVRDADALEQILVSGIGRGKAYGAGLIMAEAQ